MAFCPNCGSSVEGRFCPGCGTAVGAGPVGGSAPPPQSPATGMTDNVAAALCYIAGLISGVLFLVLAPYNQNREIRFHAFQSIFFNVAVVAVFIVEGVIASVMPFGLGIIVSLLGLVIWFGSVAVWILLLVKAYQGEKFKLPMIGDLAEKQA